MAKSSFFSLMATLATAAALSFSCSTTRVLEEGQYRLASNKVEVIGDSKFNTKKVESYIKQKPNSYIIFGWNPFLNLYNWSGRNPDKAINRLIRSIGTAPVVYQPSQVEASIENINRHLEYLGYYGSDVRSDIEVKGRKVNVTYSISDFCGIFLIITFSIHFDINLYIFFLRKIKLSTRHLNIHTN